jgi:hypothetical protein
MQLLCFSENGNDLGDICTNQCPFRYKCTNARARVPFLVETASTKCSAPERAVLGGIPTTSFSIFEVSQNAFLNGVLDEG